ncbi:Transposase IS200 like [Anaerovirgula multivorans]|uniref:Transposase IS200 like n=1 Tax=Anaerovirgula multivorans TaxID=312168 RepID=A0A239G6V9_9FIRM|nr:transposase [Anaerovirgula multivorans]SNS65076.1 Transposase IS200 like [Anaerovirgula multivorans]
MIFYAKKSKKKSESGIYHIVLRGINKQIIFEDEEDNVKFIQTLKEYKNKSGYKIYEYCLMGNHVHILLQELEEGIETIMRRIGSSYVY